MAFPGAFPVFAASHVWVQEVLSDSCSDTENHGF